MGWKKRELPEWFKEIHGLELEPKILNLNDKPTVENPWIRIDGIGTIKVLN